MVSKIILDNNGSKKKLTFISHICVCFPKPLNCETLNVVYREAENEKEVAKYLR